MCSARPQRAHLRQSRIWRFSCGFQAGRKLFGHLPPRKPWRLKDTRRLLAGASRTCRTRRAVSRRWCHGPDPIARRRVPSAGSVPSRPLALISHSEDDISRFDTWRLRAGVACGHSWMSSASSWSPRLRSTAATSVFRQCRLAASAAVGFRTVRPSSCRSRCIPASSAPRAGRRVRG